MRKNKRKGEREKNTGTEKEKRGESIRRKKRNRRNFKVGGDRKNTESLRNEKAEIKKPRKRRKGR